MGAMMSFESATGENLINQFNDYQLVVSEVLGGMDAEITIIGNTLAALGNRISEIEVKLSGSSLQLNQGKVDKNDNLITHLELAKLLARVDELEKLSKR
jgi:hypothetical protein